MTSSEITLDLPKHLLHALEDETTREIISCFASKLGHDLNIAKLISKKKEVKKRKQKVYASPEEEETDKQKKREWGLKMQEIKKAKRLLRAEAQE